jgi:polygalacturonase
MSAGGPHPGRRRVLRGLLYGWAVSTGLPRHARAAPPARRDDTQRLQAMLDRAAGGEVRIPPGEYWVDPTRSLVPRSRTRVLLDPRTVLRALPNDQQRTAVIDLTHVADVHIEGGSIIGDRDAHRGGGEWGHGVRIVSAQRITLKAMTISACWGDGVYIGAMGRAGEAVPSQSVQLQHLTCLRNRRQGLSITVASDVTVDDCVFVQTGGTAPSSGIDIEPQRQGEAKGIRIRRCTLADNQGCGVECHDNVSDVVVEACTIEGNRTHGVLAQGAHDVRIERCTIRRQGRQGLVVGRGTEGVVAESNVLLDNGTQWHAAPSGNDARLNLRIDTTARRVRIVQRPLP